MYCDKCGTKLNEDAAFCDKCGNKVIAVPQMQPSPESQKHLGNGFTDQPYRQQTYLSQQVSAPRKISRTNNKFRKRRNFVLKSNDPKTKRLDLTLNVLSVIICLLGMSTLIVNTIVCINVLTIVSGASVSNNKMLLVILYFVVPTISTAALLTLISLGSYYKHYGFYFPIFFMLTFINTSNQVIMSALTFLVGAPISIILLILAIKLDEKYIEARTKASQQIK